MARLTLSSSGLRGPLDLAPLEEAAAAPVEVPRIGPAVPPAAPSFVPPAPVTPADPASVSAPTAESAVTFRPAVTSSSPAATPTDLPAWAAALDPAVLRPERLLGRPKQTALILDLELSRRADALVAATGPRVTFAGLVTAVLHFHLPTDGEAAARTIGGYRRRRLEALEHPWEERNARLPEPLRAELDAVVAAATGRVASVRRSTLVNALLDAHLPETSEDASRLVTRMEMVRGGAFLD